MKHGRTDRTLSIQRSRLNRKIYKVSHSDIGVSGVVGLRFCGVRLPRFFCKYSRLVTLPGYVGGAHLVGELLPSDGIGCFSIS